MDVRPLVGAHRPESARRPGGHTPAVPAIPVARAASPDDDTLYFEDQEPAEPGGEEAGRRGDPGLRGQPSRQPPALNVGAVFRHHAPPPPPPPVKLPEGVANPFTSAFDTLRHPKSFPRRRPASHRISRSHDAPSRGPAETSRQRPETARVQGRGQRPGTAQAGQREPHEAPPLERPATARARRLSAARTDARAAADPHEHAADAPRPPAERPHTARTLSAVSEQKRSLPAPRWPTNVLDRPATQTAY